jgi:hypothetical protein
MSYQAYLDAIEKKTGRTPAEVLEEARGRGFDETTTAADFTAWMADAQGSAEVTRWRSTAC